MFDLSPRSVQICALGVLGHLLSAGSRGKRLGLVGVSVCTRLPLKNQQCLLRGHSVFYSKCLSEHVTTVPIVLLLAKPDSHILLKNFRCR